MKKIIAKLLIFSFLSLIFLHLYYTRYYRWIDCFNENGNCYNPDGSMQNYTTSGFVWIIPCVVCFVFAIKQVLNFFKKR